MASCTPQLSQDINTGRVISRMLPVHLKTGGTRFKSGRGQNHVIHGAAGGTRVRANTSMLVLVHGPGSGSAALAAESLLNTGKCRCDAGKVYVRCLYRR